MSKIEGHTNFERDDSNMAIINTDNSAYLQAKRIKENSIQQKNEINTLRTEVKEIKQLLLQINEKLQWQEQ
tara:strand:+ start:1822 stop:2034 length:213 start_codon:yes stop_codon:yes gene_type:complete